MSSSHHDRRQLLAAGVAVAASLGLSRAGHAQELVPTPQCDDGDMPTLRQTEGPFYKPRSPQRGDLRVPGEKGQLVDLSGAVLTRTCRTVPGALVDLWHADASGEYDNAGFRHRGHVFADGEGRFRFRTIRPARYTGRTPHYHVKVQAANRPVLTTQLYFPDEPGNARDRLFRRELLLRLAERQDGLAARFDFVLDLS
jgi:protocatechuate 3,4-dioxygenase beta subunit